MHFARFHTRIYEVRRTYAAEPWKLPDSPKLDKDGRAHELTMPTSHETVLGARTTFSQTLKANEQRCLNHVHGSWPNHVQLYVTTGILAGVGFNDRICSNLALVGIIPNQILFSFSSLSELKEKRI